MTNLRIETSEGVSNAGRRALSDLAASHPDLLVGAVEASPACITIADATMPDLPLVYANAAFTAATGYCPDEIVGRNCRFLQGPDTDKTAVDRLRRAIATARPVAIEFTNYRKDGSPFVNSLRVAPAHDEQGRLVAFIGVQHDVTLERRREQSEIERQRLAALGQLAGGVSHQLNNLLQPVISLLSLHRPDLSDADTAADFDIMLTSARQAADVVRDILAFSKGTDQPGQPTKLAAAVAANAAFLEALLPENIVTHVTLADEAGDAHVALDETQICQVLANLLINAAQAMGGTGQINIEIERPSSDWLRLSVADEGPGIPESLRLQVVEPFFSTRRSVGGTGLGLSMVYGVVKAIGGTLTITDVRPQQPPVGCRISLQLPVVSPVQSDPS